MTDPKKLNANLAKARAVLAEKRKAGLIPPPTGRPRAVILPPRDDAQGQLALAKRVIEGEIKRCEQHAARLRDLMAELTRR